MKTAIFFHAAANGQARRNKVKVIVQDGVEHYDNRKKLELATTYFSTLLGQPAPSLPTVQLNLLYNSMDLSSLASQFTWAEIVYTINHSPNNRSPGPDGFTNKFFKVFLHLLKDDLVQFFSELHHNHLDLQGINTAYIALLPKKETPLELRDYRPISLVHSVPKLASKVLANRLQGRIPDLVHPLQSGFLKGRSIVENFALAAEMIQCAHKRKMPMIALKLDFQKAFDSVSWSCLLSVLEARGFPQKWIGWITSLLSTGRSSVLINGELGQPFAAKKGLRQGDSLSPYLFILVADVLQRLCCAQFQAGNLVHPLGSDSMFPILQYADDTLLFFKGDLQQASLKRSLLLSQISPGYGSIFTKALWFRSVWRMLLRRRLLSSWVAQYHRSHAHTLVYLCPYTRSLMVCFCLSFTGLIKDCLDGWHPSSHGGAGLRLLILCLLAFLVTS